MSSRLRPPPPASATRNSPPGPKPDWTRVETVLLDMDGTLLDLSFDNFFWRERIPARFAELNGLTHEAAREHLAPRFAARQGTLEWYCTDFWTREMGFDVAALKHEERAHIRYLPGVPDFLAAVRAMGKRLLLATNAHPHSLAIKAAETGLDAYFDKMISSHDCGYPKEDPRFWEVLDDLGVYEPQTALFVDDSLPVLRAARTHGLAQLFAITRPDTTSPPHQIDEFPSVFSVSDLLPAMRPG